MINKKIINLFGTGIPNRWHFAGGADHRSSQDPSILPPRVCTGGAGNMENADENRIALAGLIVEDPAAAEEVNRILHEFSQWIVGRMGIPYRSRGVSIISIVLDAPQPVLSSLSGKLGMLHGVSVKTVCSKTQK